MFTPVVAQISITQHDALSSIVFLKVAVSLCHLLERTQYLSWSVHYYKSSHYGGRYIKKYELT